MTVLYMTMYALTYQCEAVCEHSHILLFITFSLLLLIHAVSCEPTMDQNL